MLLKSGPVWDFKEKCMWFEIQHDLGRVLCRIDGSCFLNSLGAHAALPGAYRLAFQREMQRILATASAQASARHLETAPNNPRRFVWLRDREFDSAVN
jgi:hypothetical protein